MQCFSALPVTFTSACAGVYINILMAFSCSFIMSSEFERLWKEALRPVLLICYSYTAKEMYQLTFLF